MRSVEAEIDTDNSKKDDNMVHYTLKSKNGSHKNKGDRIVVIKNDGEPHHIKALKVDEKNKLDEKAIV